MRLAYPTLVHYHVVSEMTTSFGLQLKVVPRQEFQSSCSTFVSRVEVANRLQAMICDALFGVVGQELKGTDLAALCRVLDLVENELREQNRVMETRKAIEQLFNI